MINQPSQSMYGPCWTHMYSVSAELTLDIGEPTLPFSILWTTVDNFDLHVLLGFGGKKLVGN